MALISFLTSYWQLEAGSGTRNDSHGTSHLSDNNTVGSGTGIVGNCATFNGVNQYLNVADNASLSGGDRDFSIAAWVQITDKSLGYNLIGKGTASGLEYILEYSVGSDRWRWRVWTGDAEAGGSVALDGGGGGGGNAPSTGTWYYVVAWHDSVANEIGIATSANSFTPYTAAHTTGVWNSTGDFNIGRGSSYFPTYHNGKIDQVGFWDIVLSSGQISQLYNSGAGMSYAAIVAEGSGGGGGGTPAGRRALLGVGV